MPKPQRPAEPSRVYQHLKQVFGDPSKRGIDARRRRARADQDPDSVPYGKFREPKGIADVLGAMTNDLGWTEPLAQSEVVQAWPMVVGDEMAAHSTPVTIEDHALVIRCDSTAWATQLRLMRAQITTTIAERYPEAGVESVRVLAPDAPTWKKGFRSVQGRGPRDTYG
jgi:predicted nucleic acid-binding Zn ribbon protein